MKWVAKIAVVILTAMPFVGHLHATGYFGPMVYLDEGGKNVDASPEFYWELEVKRLAREFHPIEKLVAPKKKETQADEDARAIWSQDTAEADLKDFADALKAGEIKPADPAKATQQHQAARNLIDNIGNATALPRLGWGTYFVVHRHIVWSVREESAR
jgi:antirestriction protein